MKATAGVDCHARLYVQNTVCSPFNQLPHHGRRGEMFVADALKEVPAESRQRLLKPRPWALYKHKFALVHACEFIYIVVSAMMI